MSEYQRLATDKFDKGGRAAASSRLISHPGGGGDSSSPASAQHLSSYQYYGGVSSSSNPRPAVLDPIAMAQADGGTGTNSGPPAATAWMQNMHNSLLAYDALNRNATQKGYDPASMLPSAPFNYYQTFLATDLALCVLAGWFLNWGCHHMARGGMLPASQHKQLPFALSQAIRAGAVVLISLVTVWRACVFLAQPASINPDKSTGALLQQTGLEFAAGVVADGMTVELMYLLAQWVLAPWVYNWDAGWMALLRSLTGAQAARAAAGLLQLLLTYACLASSEGGSATTSLVASMFQASCSGPSPALYADASLLWFGLAFRVLTLVVVSQLYDSSLRAGGNVTSISAGSSGGGEGPQDASNASQSSASNTSTHQAPLTLMSGGSAGLSAAPVGAASALLSPRQLEAPRQPKKYNAAICILVLVIALILSILLIIEPWN